MTQQTKKYQVYVFAPSGIIVEKKFDMKKIQAVKNKLLGNDIEEICPSACLVDDDLKSDSGEKYQDLIKECNIYVDEEGISKKLEENNTVYSIQKDTGGKVVVLSFEEFQQLPTIIKPFLGFVIAVSKLPIA